MTNFKNMIKTMGSNVQMCRLERGYSQEALALKADLHPTYIGQVERGEKNTTILTLSKLADALEVPLSTFFEDIPNNASDTTINNYPLRCYNLIKKQNIKRQQNIHLIITKILDIES